VATDTNGLLRAIERRLDAQDAKLDRLAERVGQIAEDLAAMQGRCPACMSELETLRTTVYGTANHSDRGLASRLTALETVANGISKRYWWFVSNTLAAAIGIAAGLVLAWLTRLCGLGY